MKQTSVKRILLMIVLLFCLTGCSQVEQESDTQQSIVDTDDVPNESDIPEEVTQRPEITRLDGYNSVLIKFIDLKSQTGLNMDIDIGDVESTLTHKKCSLQDAISSDIIIDYKSSLDECTFLLKEGYKLDAIMNPHNRDSLAGWEDYKSNYPFEVTAIKEANNQLNIFDITLDYSSSIVSTDVEISISK